MKKVFCFVFVVIVLSACDAGAPKMTVVVSALQAVKASASVTPTPVATKTLVPTQEPTRTASQTPIITETPTLTSSPSPTPTKETPVVIKKDNISRLTVLTEFEMETGQQLTWYPNSQKFAVLRKTDDASYIYLYEVNNFQEMMRVAVLDPGVYNFAFSPDGSEVRLASLYGVGIWNINSGEPIRDLPNDCAYYYLSNKKSTFGTDGSVAVFGLSAGRGEYFTNIEAIDISSCTALTSVHHEGWLVTLSLSPDGSHLISTAAHLDPETLFVWDTTTGELTCKMPWGFSTPIFSPDSNFFVAISGLQDQDHISLFDTQTCQSVQNFDREAFSYNFSLDGQLLFSADKKSIQVWDVATGKLIREIDDPGNRSLSISPDGRYLISIRGDFNDDQNIFRVWAIVQ